MIFHILNRGVDKRKIFMNDKDRLRFVHNLYEFNDENNVTNNLLAFFKQNGYNNIGCRYYKPRKLLVEIYAFCLMDNHYHLMLSSKTKDNIAKFMKKLNMGYAKYFNQKYQRSGALFQGKYKSISINNHSHFIHLPYYIHLNPLDYHSPEWREKKLKDLSQAIKFLKNYRWSSHLDYLGKKNFASIINKEFLLEIFGNEIEYQKRIKQFLKDIFSIRIKDIVLE
jgi:putative transposase